MQFKRSHAVKIVTYRLSKVDQCKAIKEKGLDKLLEVRD